MTACRPATLADIAAVHPRLPPRHFAAAVLQLGRSPAVAVERDGRVLCIAGLYPHTDHFEAWFAASPGLRGAAGAKSAVRAIERLLLALPADMPVVCAVRRGHETGLRLARLAGFGRALPDDGGPWRQFALDRVPVPIGCAKTSNRGPDT